jgi:prevent-host-death family protein
MKEVSLEQFSENVSRFLDAAQRERLVVTRNGEPVAVVTGIEHKDEEDFQWQANPEFWRMIEERRRQPTVPLKDVKEDLLRDD